MKKRTKIVSSMLTIVSLATLLSGCTTLGPMPGMTVANVTPNEHAGLEAEAAFVPGFFLSETTEKDPDNEPIAQISGFFDPGDLLPVAGLSVGGRWIGGGDETGYFEPLLRYRMFIDDDERMALGIVGFGTYVSRTAEGASYSMGRGGLELSSDIRVTPYSHWLELHLVGGASLSVLGGEGHYCMNEDSGFGIDCTEGSTNNANAEILGAYPSAFVGINLTLARHLDIVFHGIRIGGYIAGGTMPRVRFAEVQDSPESWFAGGASFGFGFGQ